LHISILVIIGGENMFEKKKWSKKLVAAALATLVVSTSTAFESNSLAAEPNTKPIHFTKELPIGAPGLPERRTVEHPVPGVTITTVYRGYPDTKAFFTVTVATVNDKETADNIDVALKKAGFDSRVEVLNERAPDDPATGPLGYRVRVGFFSDKSSALAMAEKIKQAGVRLDNGQVIGENSSVQYSAEDGGPTTGPWEIRILTIDPKQYHGELKVALATPDGTGSETVSSIVRRTGALIGTNASYFVMRDSDGTPGDVAGLSVVNGRLVSEAVNNTGSFILTSPNGRGARIEKLSTEISLYSSDGSSTIIDGINRKPGLILNCGGVHDTPTNHPKHDFLCTDPDEIVYFTRDYGRVADAGPGVQVTLDKEGKVVAVAEQRGGTIPDEGIILQGTGKGADWLRLHAKVGSKLYIKQLIKTAKGETLKLTKNTNIVSGGPILLKNGKPVVDAYAEGFSWPESPFYYNFGVRRHPRTIAGITADGKIIIVVADGRNPGVATGLNFKEEVDLMKSLGVTDAVNLDGGGSSTFVGPDGLRNHPSDGQERPTGDALLVMPPKHHNEK
jgi:exopolysaccharide biosynthesis protein